VVPDIAPCRPAACFPDAKFSDESGRKVLPDDPSKKGTAMSCHASDENENAECTVLAWCVGSRGRTSFMMVRGWRLFFIRRDGGLS
jgi:hypothetical protein